jgi:hypothetical protein
VLQGEQWEVPLKNACKYYFCHIPLLFCCMILFLTVCGYTSIDFAITM